MAIVIEDDNTFTVGDNSILGLEALDQDGNTKPFQSCSLIYDTEGASPVTRTSTDTGMSITDQSTAEYTFQEGELVIGILKCWWQIIDALGNTITQPKPLIIEVVADPAT